MQLPSESWMGRTRLGPWLVVGYLFVLLHAYALARAMLPRAGWMARLDHRWVDLWMR
jgi:hypothetical protein